MKIITRCSSFVVVFVLSILLLGCGGEDDVSVPWQEQPTVRFAYPYPGQTEVPVNAPVVIHLSQALAEAERDQVDERLSLQTGDDDPVPVSTTLASDGRSILLRPDQPLQPDTMYRVVLDGEMSGQSGEVETSAFQDFHFATAGLHSGAREKIGSGDFALLEVSPLDTPNALGEFPLVDFSSFRLIFNYPLVSGSPAYGDTVRLEKRVSESSWEIVDNVSLVHQERYLSLDPLNGLNPGEEYRLVLEGLHNIYGETLPLTTRTGLKPLDTAPRETTRIKVGSFATHGGSTSRLTGDVLNTIPIESFLLGNEASTELQGDLTANLGFVPNFSEAVPLRVPRGSVLTGSPVDVDLLGEIPAGLETGELKVTLVNDANGYLVPNPFSDSPNAPRYAVLSMDAALTAQGTEANAALSQTLVNVQVVGLAIVEGKSLVIDAVSVIEPDVLGLERASGLLSFRMESYPDQQNAPEPPADDRPLALDSWMPGPHQSRARPGEPVILNFNKPVAAHTLSRDGAVELRRDGELLPRGQVNMRVDGASVIIEGNVIEHGHDYEIVLSSLLEDTQGKSLSQDYELSLRLDELSLPGGSPANLRSPMVAMTYPGFPCALTNKVLSGPPENWRNGRCIGGEASDPLYPVPEIPKDAPIRVIFSRNIDTTTVIDRQTFFVGRWESGSWVPVPGRLEVTAQKLEFHPDEAWRPGALYRYSLRSNGNHQSSVANCGVNAICSPDGAPLQTRLLAQSPGNAPTRRGGGPSMWNHFRVTDEDMTPAALRALPTVDVNANLIHEPGSGENRARRQDGRLVVPQNSMRLQLAGTSGVITQANLGCSIGTNCPQNRFSYLSIGALPAELIGHDADVEVNRRLMDDNPATDNVTTGAVRANVLPTMMSLTQVFMEAQVGFTGLITVGLDTGPLMMRMEYEPDGSGGYRPISGFITETPDGLWFTAEMDLLVDAPELEPALGPISLNHDIRSKRLTNVTLEGPLRFMEDGRLQLNLRNPDPLVLNNNIDLLGIGLAGVNLRVPSRGARFSVTFLPVKSF